MKIINYDKNVKIINVETKNKKILELIIFDDDNNKDENDEKHDETYKLELNDL